MVSDRWDRGGLRYVGRDSLEAEALAFVALFGELRDGEELGGGLEIAVNGAVRRFEAAFFEAALELAYVEALGRLFEEAADFQDAEGGVVAGHGYCSVSGFVK